MLSKEFLLERGYCCGHGCLMCPYEPKHIKGNKNTMKQFIDCNQNHNPIINKKLKEVSVEEGLVIAEELFQIHNKRKDGIGLTNKWELMKWPLSMFVNLWYSSIRRLYQRKIRLIIMKVVYLTPTKEYPHKDIGT